jgi:5'-methylthioadenosine phosphorylase
MRLKAAIIGGTGVGERLAEMGGVPLFVPSSEGMLRGRVIAYEGAQILIVSRHSAGHKVPPHRVNYAAIAKGLQQLGIKACFSTAAVGSLRAEWKPGTLVAVSDFLDLSFRNLTLFNKEVVHRDFSEPFSNSLRENLLETAKKQGLMVEPKGIYINGNGPRYETPEEIQTYRRLGGDLVGMTAASEAILMREAGVPYACLAIVTNLAAGMDDEVLEHGDVVRVMRSRTEAVVPLLLAAALRVPS